MVKKQKKFKVYFLKRLADLEREKQEAIRRAERKKAMQDTMREAAEREALRKRFGGKIPDSHKDKIVKF